MQAHARTRSAPALRVAIVEDDPLIAWDLKMTLAEAGHEVCGMASEAGAAVALADRERPDVMLMDIRLAHGTDGIAAAQEIRERFGIPSVFLSGNLDPITRERAATARPLATIGKPYLSAELLRALDFGG